MDSSAHIDGHPWLQLSFQQDARCSDLLHDCKQTLGDLIADLPHVLISAAMLKVKSRSLHYINHQDTELSHTYQIALSLFLSLLLLPSVLSPNNGPLLCYSFTSLLPGLPSLWCLRPLLFPSVTAALDRFFPFAPPFFFFFLLRSSLVVSTSPSSSSVDSCLSRGNLCMRPSEL